MSRCVIIAARTAWGSSSDSEIVVEVLAEYLQQSLDELALEGIDEP